MKEDTYEKLVAAKPTLIKMFLEAQSNQKVTDDQMAHELGLNAKTTYSSKKKKEKFDWEQTLAACKFLKVDYEKIIQNALTDEKVDELFLPVKDVKEYEENQKYSDIMPVVADYLQNKLVTKDDLENIEDRIANKVVEKLLKQLNQKND